MSRFAAAVLVPGLLFAALCGAPGGPCLASYAWTSGVGYAPTTAAARRLIRARRFGRSG